jgi:hypothetical protein
VRRKLIDLLRDLRKSDVERREDRDPCAAQCTSTSFYGRIGAFGLAKLGIIVYFAVQSYWDRQW